MNAKLWKTAIISGVISVLTAVFLLTGAIFLSLRGQEPEKYIGFWATAALAAGGALSGGLAAKLYGERTLAAPLLAGGIYLVVIALVTMPFGEGFSAVRFLLNAGIPLLAALSVGGLLCARGTSRFGNSRKAAKHAGKMYKGRR